MKAATPTPPRARGPSQEAQADLWVAVARQQFEATNRIARSMIGGVENLRRCQLEAAQRAREQHEQAQSRLAGSGSATQVLEAQAELIGADLQAALRYGQQVWSLCAAASVELLEEWNAGVRETGEQWARLLPALGGSDGRLASGTAVDPGRPVQSGVRDASPAGGMPGHSASATANEIDRMVAQLWKPWIHTVEPWRAMLLPRIELP